VAAQVPPPEPDVNVTAAQTERVIERGECASFPVTVQNTGQIIPAVLVRDKVQVRVSAAQAGWTINPNPAGEFELGRGESRSLTLGLCAGESVARGTRGSVTFTAEITDAAELSEPAQDQVVLTARIEESGLLGIPNVPSFVIWIALGAVGLLLATAVLARRKPGAAIAMECREPSKEVQAGRGTSFPVRIANEGRARDLVGLTTSPVPRGWDTFLPVVDVPLEPGEEQTVWISVKSPEDARPGDHIAVKVFARSSAAGGEQASIDLLTTVRGGENVWGGGVSMGGGDDEERSVYAPEAAGKATGRGVAVKRRVS
jgi:uncharacterized membrane protein